MKGAGGLSSTNRLLQSSLFIDECGLLRVSGRLANSRVRFEKRHPILLPADGEFTRLLFEREHKRLLHAGPTFLLCSVRERYWPLKGRNLVRKTVHSCVTCFRNKPKPLTQLMGQLPGDRIIATRPFFNAGIDFTGPIITLVNRGRARKTNKSYIALFICFSTKAIHVEVVSDLNASAFIAALRRFAERRGAPQRIYCDNASNFVGARSELNDIYQLACEEMSVIYEQFSRPNNIDWRFIPPYTPHMGGLWEAGVKSCKFHLKQIVG